MLATYVGGEGGEGGGGGEGGEAVLKAVELTTDHTPAYPPERERIRASGAFVQEENWDEDGCFEPARIYRTAEG